jgi:hypothetical protein
MLQGMSSKQFVEWQAYASVVGGFGDEQADRRCALLCAILVQINTPKGKSAPMDFDDFLSILRPHERPAPTAQTLKAQFAQLAEKSKVSKRRTPAPKVEQDGAANVASQSTELREHMPPSAATYMPSKSRGKAPDASQRQTTVNGDSSTVNDTTAGDAGLRGGFFGEGE